VRSLNVSQTGRVAAGAVALSLFLAGLLGALAPLDALASTYSSGVLATSGLYCYWRLNETSGNFNNANSCGQTFNHLGGSVSYHQAGAIVGDSDTSATFGSNGYASGPTTGIGTGNFANNSWEFWLNFPTTRTNNNW
jgi:hypothetical protein